MKKLILFCSIAFLLFGCVKNNPQPVWLNLSTWTLVPNTDPDAQNHPSYMGHNFTDAWVYVDNKLIGVFELPKKIPVLVGSGTRKIRIYPTIRNNGISATKKIYPFVKSFEQDLELVEGQTYDVNLTTMYNTSTTFWTEDFSDNSPEITATSGTITVESDPDIAISGKYGHVHLDANSTTFSARTNAIQLPGASSEVYLELNYRTDISIVTSLVAVMPDASVNLNQNIQLNANNQWRKIYIDLKELVTYWRASSASSFQQQLDAMIQDQAASRDIYIDNIRLVY